MARQIVNGRRVVKNTLVNYFQVILSALVGLITSRLVLQCLGVSDYGLYNVVGGLVAMFSFISNSMSTTTSRFLNIEMGIPKGNINRVFNVSNVLHILTAIVLLLFIEILGLFYITHYFNVDPGKEADSLFVFQISTVVTCIGVINVPYRALLIAYEQFKTIALVEITNSILKLLLVVALTFYHGNALRLYAVMVCTGTGISFIAYHYICIRRWPFDVKWKFVSNLKTYKDQLYLNNWAVLLMSAVTGRSQGSHLLMNYFFGTVVNAAYAVSLSVQGIVNILSSNFSKAANPQIIKLVGAGEYENATEMAAMVGRAHLLLMEIIFFPLIVELDFLLQLWLGGNVPSGTNTFCQLTLLLALFISTDSGPGMLIYAYGRVKWFWIIASFWILVCLPIGYLAFSNGYPAYTILILFIVAEIMIRTSQLWLMKRTFNFDIPRFSLKAWLRPTMVFILMSCFLITYWHVDICQTWLEKLAGILMFFNSACIMATAIGLVPKERELLINYIKNKVWR